MTVVCVNEQPVRQTSVLHITLLCTSCWQAMQQPQLRLYARAAYWGQGGTLQLVGLRPDRAGVLLVARRWQDTRLGCTPPACLNVHVLVPGAGSAQAFVSGKFTPLTAFAPTGLGRSFRLNKMAQARKESQVMLSVKYARYHRRKHCPRA